MKKLSFIADVEFDGFEKTKEEQSEYSEIVQNVQEFFNLKICLKKMWDEAEQKYIASDKKIVDSKDQLEIVTCPDKEICKGIEALMNLAYREGMRKTINTIKNEFGF